MLSTSHQIARYLATTDFNLILNCMQQGLSPQQCRILHYIHSYIAHDLEDFDLVESADWLGIDPGSLERELRKLEKLGAIWDLKFEEGNAA
jgi:DNA-binding MarR family transcriptional regulator